MMLTKVRKDSSIVPEGYATRTIEEKRTEYRTPDRNDNNLVFAVYQDREKPDPRMIYFDLGRPWIVWVKVFVRMGTETVDK